MTLTYMRCNRCNAINWRSSAALRHFGYGCRKCGANETRRPIRLSLIEKIYLLRWFWWEMNMKNRELCDGEPDPHWYCKPKNLLTFMEAFRRGTATQEPG